MAVEHSMTQEITQAATEATKAEGMVGREADNPVSNSRPIHIMLRSSGSVLRQTKFDWRSLDKYQKLCNFEMEVKKHFYDQTLNYTRKQQGPNNTQ